MLLKRMLEKDCSVRITSRRLFSELEILYDNLILRCIRYDDGHDPYEMCFDGYDDEYC